MNKEKIICKFENCNKKEFKDGYCKKHFKIVEKMKCYMCGKKLSIFIGKETNNFCSKNCLLKYLESIKKPDEATIDFIKKLKNEEVE